MRSSRTPRRYFSWQTSIKTSGLIKYLAIDHTKKWCKWKRCKIMRRFTSRSLICNAVKIYQSAEENRCWSFLQIPIKTSRYLTIDHTKKWCIQRCKIMRRFTSHSCICDMIEIRWRALDNRRTLSFFRMFFTALRWIFTISQIGKLEANLRIILHRSRIHHFVVWSIAKYLISPEVLMGVCQEK